MFTGIIQDLGTIKNKEQGLYQISTNLDLSKCKEGSSISCNGVCLTAKNIIKIDYKTFSFEVNIGEETLKRTNLVNKVLKLKDKKNQIIDQKRINLILKNIKKKSLKNKIDPKITHRIWKNMIWAYIDYEKRNFKKK